MKDLFKRQEVYSVAGISRQGYFKAQNNKVKRVLTEDLIIEQVKVYRKKHRRAGSRSMFYQLKITNVGINKFEQIVSKHGLTVPTKRKRIKTTEGKPESSDKNLINGIALNGPDQLIAGDITYFSTRNKQFFVFTLKDAYTKRILSLVGNENMKSANAIKALKQVIKERGKDCLKGTIHHTDAGTQYKSNAYKKLLKDTGMQMSIANNCLENGMAEQLNDILKNYYLEFENIENIKQLNIALDRVKNLINKDRSVKKLKYKTPEEFESMVNEKAPEARPVFKLYDFTQTHVNKKGNFVKA